MKIWPLLVLIIAGLTVVVVAQFLSRGLPWGIDDGVKRLMARQWIQSGGRSVAFVLDGGSLEERRHFPIPPPFAEPAENGFRTVFPALFPAVGGCLRSLLGDAGIYLLPSFGFVLLLFFFVKSLRGFSDQAGRLGAAFIIGCSLYFYALTFWEHTLALLCLLPLMNVLIHRPNSGRSSWRWAGAALGVAISLRLETALLIPPLLVVLQIMDPVPANRWSSLRNCLFPLLLGCVAVLIALCSFEYFAAGRFVPPQAGVNLALAFQGRNFLGHLERIFAMLLNSPMEAWLYGLLLLLALAISIIMRSPLIFACLLPLLSLALLIWGWLEKGAFGLVSQSQGLFFALPWLGIILLGKRSRKQPPDAFTVLGGGYVILLYLLAPNQPGLHWGPRFLFPALLPLLFRSVIVLQEMPSLRWRRTLMTLTAAAAIVSGSASVAALAERGSAGARVASVIREQNLNWLAANRWHVGADLEPLWTELRVAWTPELGSLEELLISASQKGDSLRLGFLWQNAQLDADQLPLQIEGRIELPQRAGWGGELLTAGLTDSSDRRWGGVYWHAARRRAEANDFPEALWYLEKAAGLAPQNPDILYDRAVCLGRMGRIDEAILTLERVLALNPHHEAGQNLRRRLTTSR